MKFNNEILNYLRGDSFSNSLKISISNPQSIILDRLGYLEDAVRGRRILHLGCADHRELIEYKIKHNLWLHARLTNNAGKCIGVDIDKKLIDFIRDQYEFNNIIYANILDKNDLIDSDDWDDMVMGEVLEHIDNPVCFLREIKEKFRNNLKRIIISVPNAFAYKNLRNALKNIEEINSDHRYYFTPYTLGKILTIAGFEIQCFVYAETMPIISSFKHGRYMFHDFIHKIRLKRSPALCNHLIMTAKL